MTDPLFQIGDPFLEPVTSTQLAGAYGVDIRSVQIWDQKGWIRRQERGLYILRDVIRGVYEAQLGVINRKKGPEGDEYEQLEKREQKAKTEKAEIEVRRLQGDLISADEVRTATFERARLVRDRLENIPSRISATVAAESDEQRVKELITREINLALEELST